MQLAAISVGEVSLGSQWFIVGQWSLKIMIAALGFSGALSTLSGEFPLLHHLSIAWWVF